jgi:hypothetical protein
MQNMQIHFLLVVILTMSIVGCSAPGIPTQNVTPAPSMTLAPHADLEVVEGNFRNQIRLLEENMPRSGSEAYVIPGGEEQTDFSKLVSLIHAGEFGDAAQVAAAISYRLNYYVDQDDHSAASYLLREQKPIQKGWGLYAFRAGSTSNIIIEAPHPLYDRRTPTVAMDVYRALDARALLIAGAHRNANQDGSADAAHAPESIFQSVHKSLVREIQSESGDAIILQIHGFHSSKHEGYPQVVFGLGKNAQKNEVALAERIKDALAEQGIAAGICTGKDFQDLCAETNIQSSVTNEGAFIHMELDEKLRKNDGALIAALLQVFGQ